MAGYSTEGQLTLAESGGGGCDGGSAFYPDSAQMSQGAGSICTTGSLHGAAVRPLRQGRLFCVL